MPGDPLRNPSNPLRTAWGITRAFPGLLILLIGLVVYNLGQLLSLALYPISRRAFRAYNRLGADLWWRCFAALARGLHRVTVRISGDELPARENVLLIANHQQMTDICFLILLACRCRAAGDTKWFVKNAIKYVPLMGWGMLFLDNLFVKRSWAKDRRSIERTFGRINEDRVPIWLILFAEGTRLTMQKLASSQKIAARKNRAPTSHVLLPRTKGFSASVIGLRGHLDAVYDVTIAYEDGVPSLWQFICGHVRSANLHVRRIPERDLPVEERELASWLLDRFAEKDALLETFYRCGKLDPGPCS